MTQKKFAYPSQSAAALAARTPPVNCEAIARRIAIERSSESPRAQLTQSALTAETAEIVSEILSFLYSCEK